MIEPTERPESTAPMADTLAGEVRDSDRAQVFETTQSQRATLWAAREDQWEAWCARYAEPSNLTLEQFNAKIEQNTQEILRKVGY